MRKYNERRFEKLSRAYTDLCYSLGKDDEAERIPTSKAGLIKRVGELNFDWLHEHHIG